MCNMNRARTRASLRKASVLLCAGLSSAACDEDGVRTLKDTEGRRFEAHCQDEACALERLEKPSPGEKPHAVLTHTGRLVGVCDVDSPTAEPRDWDCRALECTDANTCPPLYGLKQGDCLNGLCIDPANPMSPADAVMLCLAGTGLGRNAPKQIERYALALNCGNPCRIPAPCRQP